MNFLTTLTFRVAFVIITLSAFLTCSHTSIQPEAVPEVFGLQRPNNESCLATSLYDSQSKLIFEEVFPGMAFHSPVAFKESSLPDGGWFIVDQDGIILQVTNNGSQWDKEVILDIRDRVTSQEVNPEVGLLGIALHPGFSVNYRIFLFYIGNLPEIDYTQCVLTNACPVKAVLSEFTYDSINREIDPDSERKILEVPLAAAFHHGGTLDFGPDGFLYMSLGDGGNTVSAQDTLTLPGSLLRIDIDSTEPYGIPSDNPFVSGGGTGEIYAYGFRNPWKWSFDKGSGDIWLGDVGQNQWEEINLIKAAQNYGWPWYEGFRCYSDCSIEGLTEPIYAYSHDDGCSVTGGFVYRGENISTLKGTYIFGDFCTGNIWGLNPSNEKYNEKILSKTSFVISSFSQDTTGEVYLADYYQGKIYKIKEIVQSVESQIPPLLSQTGCVDRDDPTKPAEGLIPYSVNVPLWSDDAQKDRWLAIPNGTFIQYSNKDSWILPEGSVLIKNFSLDDKLVETRLLLQPKKNQWVGITYEWNEDQSEATLVGDSGKLKILPNGHNWWFPGRVHCFRCHTEAAGIVLGVKTAQLNREFLFKNIDTVGNQIDVLAQLGVFDGETGKAEDWPKFPSWDEEMIADENVALFARAYLDVNCAMCHREGGAGAGKPDFRYSLPFSEMNICKEKAALDDIQIDENFILSPQKYWASILFLRMDSLSFFRMPPIATNKIDEKATSVIKRWIESILDCH